MIKSVGGFAVATCWIEILPQLPKMDWRNRENFEDFLDCGGCWEKRTFWSIVILGKKDRDVEIVTKL